MSKRRQGAQMIYKSLIYNWMQYITGASIHLNPIYKAGFGLAKSYDAFFCTRKIGQVHPQFSHEIKIVEGLDNPTSLNLKWINGYTRKYDLSQLTKGMIDSEIKAINKSVELERQLAGNDDEID